MKIIEETYNWMNTNFKEHKPNAIVVHHALSQSCTAQNVHSWHLARGWKGIAYHYFIRKDGSVYRGRKEKHKGGHLLSAENNNTLGICLEGCYTDYVVNGKVLTEIAVPDAQMNSLILLVKDIKTRWAIKAIKKHADYPSAKKEGKDCPGKYFPWERFINLLSDPVAQYKAIIQERCKFSNPQGVWGVMDTHPYASALYQQWADSYK